MFKKFRIFLVRQLIELNEHLIFNKRLVRFYKKTFGNNLNVVIDVGANLGQTIDIVLKINPNCKIYAFEPNTVLFEKLCKKYEKKTNIHLFKMGISNEVGTKTFHENVLHSTSTLENINIDSKYLHRKSAILGVKPENITKESYSINVTKLSTFIKDNCANENIDLLKIDTEGHEYSCLLGLFDNENNVSIKYLQLESHNDDMYHNTKSFSEISDLLKENHFELAEKIKHGFGNIDEVLFVHKG